ncbi:MAG: type II toxin-antitoxin system RelE/ParE family toxin [Chitinophagaceae bacterium]|nr:type II toxin-antitoxin system RelE/ParE family toxin [Chitinophagaceae bacterium]
MVNYFLTNKALEDLSRIWDYTFETWSEAQADKYYFMLIDSCQELGDKKVFGKSYPDVHDEIFGYKIGQHIIFYRPAKGAKIEVVRILHSRMDLRNRIAGL